MTQWWVLSYLGFQRPLKQTSYLSKKSKKSSHLKGGLIILNPLLTALGLSCMVRRPMDFTLCIASQNHGMLASVKVKIKEFKEE